MQVDFSGLTIADGIISSGDKTMSYAQAVEGVTEWEVPETFLN